MSLPFFAYLCSYGNPLVIYLGNSRPLILVTGATGALGPRVVEALHQSGYSVRVLALDPPEPKMFSPTTDFQPGDINDERAVRTAVAGVTTIIHMAALLHINTSSPKQL